MLICTDIVIPPSTPKESPARVFVEVPPGIIRKVWVLIPHGHKALAHLVIKHGETQIIPWSGDIHGDGEQLVFDETYELKSKDELVLEGWNDDVQYPHRFIVRLLILPPLFAYPEAMTLTSLKFALGVMGIE